MVSRNRNRFNLQMLRVMRLRPSLRVTAYENSYFQPSRPPSSKLNWRTCLPMSNAFSGKVRVQPLPGSQRLRTVKPRPAAREPFVAGLETIT